MPTAKIKITYEVEFEANTDWYPEIGDDINQLPNELLKELNGDNDLAFTLLDDNEVIFKTELIKK